MISRFMSDMHTLYEQNSKAAVVFPGNAQQLILYSIQLLNRTTAPQDMGVLIKLAPTNQDFGLITGGATVADQTVAIQSGVTQDIFTTTVGDGFLIQSNSKFNLVGLAVTQAQTGSPVYSYQYYNGTSYVPLPDIIDTPDFSTTGDKLVVFGAPRLWVPGSTGAVGGSSTKYSLLVTATTAPTLAVQANDLWVGKFLYFQTQVGLNGTLNLNYPEKYPRQLDANEGILPYFKVSSPKNCVSIQYFSQE